MKPRARPGIVVAVPDLTHLRGRFAAPGPPMPRSRPPLPAPRRLKACLALACLGLAALALLAVDAVDAAAATPFTAGTGTRPAVAVGPDGRGHVVWETGGANARVGYCRVDPGASACEDGRLLTFRDYPAVASAGRAQVFISPTEPDEIWVTAGCVQCPSGDTTSRTMAWISADGGDSFTPAFPIDTGSDVNGLGTMLFDLAPSFVGTNTSRVKAAPGVPGFDGIRFASGGVFSYGSAVARVPLPGTVRLVAAVNDLSRVKYGVYRSAGPHSAASINRAENWEVDKTLVAAEPDDSDTSLSSGPNGLFLTYLSDGADPHVGLRRFDPGTDTFGLPTYVEGGDPIDDNILAPAGFQDPAGRIHVVWESLHDGGRLRYVVSGTAGSGFGAAANLAAGERFAEPRVAAGADGHGFAVWKGAGGEIRVAALDPQPEPAGPAPAEPAGPSGPGASPASPGAADRPPAGTRVPVVSGARVGKAELRPGEETELRFRSSEAGTAVLTIERRFRGLRVGTKAKRGRAAGKTCRPRTARRLRALRRHAATRRAYRRLLRKRGCRGWRRVGRIHRQVHPGLNTIPFGGRVAGRRLAPGRYRARLVVTDGEGRPSRTETVRFEILPARGGPPQRLVSDRAGADDPDWQPRVGRRAGSALLAGAALDLFQ